MEEIKKVDKLYNESLVEDKMDWEIDTYGEMREIHRRIWWGNLTERGPLEDVCVEV
jgi:hypothetical protein